MTNLNKTSSKVGAGVATGLMTIVGSCAASALAAKILGKSPLLWARRALVPASVVAIATGTAAALCLPHIGAFLGIPGEKSGADGARKHSSVGSKGARRSSEPTKPSSQDPHSEEVSTAGSEKSLPEPASSSSQASRGEEVLDERSASSSSKSTGSGAEEPHSEEALDEGSESSSSTTPETKDLPPAPPSSSSHSEELDGKKVPSQDPGEPGVGKKSLELKKALRAMMYGSVADFERKKKLQSTCQELLNSGAISDEELNLICRDLPWGGGGYGHHPETALKQLRGHLDDETLLAAAQACSPLALLQGFGYGEVDEAASICQKIIDQEHTAGELVTLLSDSTFCDTTPTITLRNMLERLKSCLPETDREIVSLFRSSKPIAALVLDATQLASLPDTRSWEDRRRQRLFSTSDALWNRELADWLNDREGRRPLQWPGRLRCCIEDKDIRQKSLKEALKQADKVEKSSRSDGAKRALDYLQELVAFTVEEEDIDFIAAEIKVHSEGVTDYGGNEFPAHALTLFQTLRTAIPDEAYLELLAQLETPLVRAMPLSYRRVPTQREAIFLKALATSWTANERIDDLLTVLTSCSAYSYQETGRLFKVPPEEEFTSESPRWADYVTGCAADSLNVDSLNNFCRVVRQTPPATVQAVSMDTWSQLLELYAQAAPKTPPYELICALPWVASKQESPEAARQAGKLFFNAFERFGCSQDTPSKLNPLQELNDEHASVAWHVGRALGESEQAEHFVAGIQEAMEGSDNRAPIELARKILTQREELNRFARRCWGTTVLVEGVSKLEAVFTLASATT